ncbi:hypothetical protein [Agarilytica rhodophyticola]|uniref:hypothetical protein n=1 Tax=Agarilytica rhodophyticola TaxID=1737490 RepID=UPI001319D366|nr:hypothetical protein [Agarilytica rhodophyticola]
MSVSDNNMHLIMRGNASGRGFTIPDWLLDNVSEDRYNNAVNKFQHYDTGTLPQ